jgi:hypothetical protein
LRVTALLSKSLVSQSVSHRVARWFIFVPKIPIWVFFGGP